MMVNFEELNRYHDVLFKAEENHQQVIHLLGQNRKLTDLLVREIDGLFGFPHLSRTEPPVSQLLKKASYAYVVLYLERKRLLALFKSTHDDIQMISTAITQRATELDPKLASRHS